jgi:hypothetical protein
MKRHGAALVLAGWYLVSPKPLVNPSGQGSPVLVDVSRPLSEWKVEKTFDAVGKCQAYLSDWIISQRSEAEKLPKPLPASVMLEANVRSNSKCVASEHLQAPK